MRISPSSTLDRSPSVESAVLACICIIASCLLVVATFPLDTVSPGALREPAAIFSVALLLPTAITLFRHGVSSVLRAEAIIRLAIVYFLFLDIIQGLYPVEVDRGAVLTVFVAVTVFVVALHLGTIGAPWRLPRTVVAAAGTSYSPERVLAASGVCFVVGTFYFVWSSSFDIGRVVAGLQAERFGAPWSRGSIGGWTAFIEHLAYFGYLLPSLTILMALSQKRWLTWQVGLTTVFSLLFLPFIIQSGGRRLVGVCVGAAFFTWLCSVRKRLTIVHIGISVFFVLASLILMELMLSTRSTGLKYSESFNEIQSVRVDDNFLRFSQIVDIIPRFHPHVGFDWVVWVIARPVPRVFWPNKPLRPGFDLAAYLSSQADSLTATSISEWYMAFSWVGLIVGGYLYGRLCAFWSQLLEYDFPPAGTIMYSLGLLALFLSIRGQLELILMSYPLLAWIALNRFTTTKGQHER